MARELISADCKGQCTWAPTSDLIDDRRVFVCAGCSSEWTHDQAWTPRNADGDIASEVAAERAAHPVSAP